MSDTALLKQNLSVFHKRYPDSRPHFESYSRNLKTPLTRDSALDSAEQNLRFETKTPPVGALILVGLGEGSYFLTLLSHLHAKTEEVIVIEPSLARFLSTLAHSDLGAILENPKIHWWVGLDERSLIAKTRGHFLELARAIRWKSHRIEMHPILEKKDPAYAMACNAFQVGIQALELEIGDAEDAWNGLTQTFANLSDLPGSLSANRLRQIAEGTPALVISAGPSLTASLPLIARARERALILATDASLKILLKAGIEPDFVCLLERDIGSLPYLDQLSASAPPLVTFPTSHPDLLAAYPAEKIFFFRDYGYHRMLSEVFEIPTVSVGHSVSHLTARLGHWLGARPICLVAQDLSYDPKTLQSHATGLALAGYDQPQSLDQLREPLQWLPGKIEGEQVPSQPLWHLFLNEFALMSNEMPELVNVSLGGAQIPFIPNAQLENLIHDWKPISRTPVTERVPTKDFSVFRQSLRDTLSAAQQNLQGLEEKHRTSPEARYSIRAEQLKMIQEPLYFAFVAEVLGASFLRLENDLYTAFTFSKDSARQDELLASWFTLHVRQVNRLIGFLNAA